MKYLFAAVLVAGSFASFSAANAAGGCGPGFHRGPYGGCQPNRGAVVVVVRPAPVVVVRPGPASAPTARSGATDAAASSDVTRSDEKSPAHAGLFLLRY